MSCGNILMFYLANVHLDLLSNIYMESQVTLVVKKKTYLPKREMHKKPRFDS